MQATADYDAIIIGSGSGGLTAALAQRPRAILSIQSGDRGMAPSPAPAALDAGLQSYYFDGACYPCGGGHAIPDALAKHIKLNGGEVFLGARVDRILVESGSAVGVRLADGREVRANVVISNADPGVTWGRLVAREHEGAWLRWRIARMRHSVSALSLFLAVDMNLRAAGLDSGDVWYSRTTDIDAAYRAAISGNVSAQDAIPALFFNVTTLKDPSLRKDGLHTVEALALSTPSSFRARRNSGPGQRGEAYAALKEQISSRILADLDRFVRGFSKRVVFQSLATPLTNMHVLEATEGGIYGIAENTEKPRPLQLSRSHPSRRPLPVRREHARARHPWRDDVRARGSGIRVGLQGRRAAHRDRPGSANLPVRRPRLIADRPSTANEPRLRRIDETSSTRIFGDRLGRSRRQRAAPQS